MADFLAIADAIAVRFGTVAPPAGQPAIRMSTARPPNAISVSPFVVVWVDSGSDTWVGGQLIGESDFKVAFHLARHRADVARDIVAIDAWVGALRPALFAQMKLGLAPIVTKALVTTWETASLTYGGEEFDGIVFTVRVWTEETVAATP